MITKKFLNELKQGDILKIKVNRFETPTTLEIIIKIENHPEFARECVYIVCLSDRIYKTWPNDNLWKMEKIG